MKNFGFTGKSTFTMPYFMPFSTCQPFLIYAYPDKYHNFQHILMNAYDDLKYNSGKRH